MSETTAPRASSSPSGHDLAPHSPVDASCGDDPGSLAHELICTRHNIPAKRLGAPGPDAAQVERLLQAAAAAPDHGQLTPWRFVIVPPEKRFLLADAFAAALLERDAGASAEQVAAAREKAHRAPFLMQAIVQLGGDGGIAAAERILSLGCALQNMLLCAHAMGFGAGLTSGQAMSAPQLRALFRLADDEQAICCINVGTVMKRKPPRVRPMPAAFTSTL